MELVVGIGFVTAVAAAFRSTWSPCGQSMLSQITPLGERARGHRFGATATWFILGAAVGGLTLGAVTAALAAGVAAADPSTTIRLGLVAILALASATVDAHLFGFGPPFIRRQLNEDWLPKYRSWVYGGGFGWQIGSGVATYVMTTAVFLLVAVGAITGSPPAALSMCMLFALARGLAVLLAIGFTTPAVMMAFFRRFDALAPASRNAVIAVQVVVAAVAAGGAWGPGGAIVVAMVSAGAWPAVRARLTTAAPS
ncbi:MAG: hypothetical protein ACRDWD_16890 [Acidimicrobiia bacterium]